MSKVLDLHAGPRPKRREVVPSAVLAMLIFVGTEIMLFAGLISGFMIVKGVAPVWPPPDQPRLPVSATAFNTAVLIASAVLLLVANHNYRNRGPAYARVPMLAALCAGIFFVGFQGREWVQLIAQGLTLTSSTYGAFFYLIVGVHGLHAVVAIAALSWAFRQLVRGRLRYHTFLTVQVFWFFVVGIWPILYMQVYL